MHITAIIPARLKSTRLPAKALADINGRSLIEWVHNGVSTSKEIDEVIVATDSIEIVSVVESFGGRAVMTSEEHTSGTDRIAEVAKELETDIILNIQGDEPLIKENTLASLIALIQRPQVDIATLYTAFSMDDVIFDPNVVKVVTDKNGKCLYFSRQAIPAQRDRPYKDWLLHSPYYQHMGVYAFKRDTLLALTALAPSHLEVTESLEQLRWLENGYAIFANEVPERSIGVDTEDDLKRVRKILKNL